MENPLAFWGVREFEMMYTSALNSIKNFLDLPGDLGQSDLTLQLLQMVILANQYWHYNCFEWKQS